MFFKQCFFFPSIFLRTKKMLKKGGKKEYKTEETFKVSPVSFLLFVGVETHHIHVLDATKNNRL